MPPKVSVPFLLADEPAWRRFQDAVLAFARPQGAADAAVFAALSARERQVLALMGEGLGNTDIATRLHISEKTVRNHASNIFDKLGVWSRTQAIVFARDRGFTGEQPRMKTVRVADISAQRIRWSAAWWMTGQ